ncbi:unnamed protein product [Ceutorhynchus assimilis]|uniref:Uncharacterized protein n=1 Tax=Ceutorhynchus assimilis TaxID=467358 RepID=A0A9N9MNV3_9CUCU|nr:unnamed protein product [Ceutorhynchus assimilis]
MCFLKVKDALVGFLTLIVTLSDDMGVACKPINDHSPIINIVGDSEDSELTPLVRELKSLKNHLGQSTSTGLHRIYGHYIKQMKVKNLQNIEDRLAAINSTFLLLYRIYRLLYNYQCDLKKIQDYVLNTDGNFSQQIKQRREIFKDLKDYLSLALSEVKNILDETRRFKKHGCRMNLVTVFSDGDLGTMQMMDNNFVEHLNNFLDIAISLVQKRQIIEQAYYYNVLD